VNLVIVFLLAVTTSIDYSNTAEVFKVLVTVVGVKGNCGEEVEIMVAYKTQTFELCEGDERPLEEQFFMNV
jgi:hypothetical protein